MSTSFLVALLTVHLPSSPTRHRTPSFCYTLEQKKPNTGLFLEVAVDERSLAAQHASSRRCMRACACERMQPAVFAVTRPCMPTRDCVCQHAAVFASRPLGLRAAVAVCAHTLVNACSRLCWQSFDGACRHATVFANMLLCSPTRTRVRELDGLLACSPPCSRFCGCAPKFCAVREDSRLCSRAAPPVR